MAFIDTWREDVKSSLAVFEPLTHGRPNMQLAYGLCGAAVLWPLRERLAEREALATIRTICGPRSQHVEALFTHCGFDPLTCAHILKDRTAVNPHLKLAIDDILATFVDVMLTEQFLQPVSLVTDPTVTIAGKTYAVGPNRAEQTAGAVVHAPDTVFPPKAHFSGRREALRQLRYVLSEGQPASIVGMSGFGKTVLAQQFCHQFRDFYSAVFWLTLGPNPRVMEYLLRLGWYTDPDFSPGQASLDRLVDRVRVQLAEYIRKTYPGPVLLVFDDVWAGLSAEAVRTLRQVMPAGASMLLTTRSRRAALNLNTVPVSIGALSLEEGLTMLRRLLPQASDGMRLKLVESIEGHPLALEVAAGHLLAVGQSEAEGERLLAMYEAEEGGAFELIQLKPDSRRHASLERVLAASYMDMSRAERTCFRALGVFAYDAPFDAGLCQAVWTTDWPAPFRALKQRRLIKSVVNGAWCQQHPAVWAYARALLYHTGENGRAFGQYSDYVIEYARAFDELPASEWRTLPPYLPHLHEVSYQLIGRCAAASLNPALSHRALQFALHTHQYLAYRPELGRVEWLEMGLQASRLENDMPREALFLRELGLFHRQQRRWMKALTAYEQALDLYLALGDSEGEALTLSRIGEVQRELGQA